MFNKITAVEGYLNHFWLAAFSDKKIKSAMGFKYLSHMWDQKPYWYLWPEEKTGVYKLEVVDAQEVNGYDWTAQFIIKYYPRRDEELFKKLSVVEQICRTSDIFHNHPAGECGCPLHGANTNGESKFKDLGHESGVPSSAVAQQLPADFFFAGQIVIAYKKDQGSTVRIKSQNIWRVIMTDDLFMDDDEGHRHQVLHKGEIDRNYPGFEITEFFCNKFLVGWRLFHSYTNIKKNTWKRGGVLFFSDGSSLMSEPSKDIDIIIQEYQTKYQPESLPSLEDDDIAFMHQNN